MLEVGPAPDGVSELGAPLESAMEACWQSDPWDCVNIPNIVKLRNWKTYLVWNVPVVLHENNEQFAVRLLANVEDA